MTQIITCPECGNPIDPDTPQGLCPRCLVTMGLAIGVGSAPTPFEKLHLDEGQPEAAELSFGNYELLNEIARGGMGVVYRARQVDLNRIVAIKMLLFGQFSSNEFVRRFKGEAQAVASLNHPNIVSIHEVGEHQKQLYFSMDYIDGKNLAELTRERPATVRKAVTWVKLIAEAIHYAHQQGILHRDLKPSNILVDAHDQPHITDFGLAKRIDGNGQITQTGEQIGTPSYSAPEQLQGNQSLIGPGSDVYSLGALFYHLLTGRPPFSAETLEETLRQVIVVEAAPLRMINAAVPLELESICLKCLNKKPVARYPDALSLAEDLDRWLSGKPVLAKPTTAIQRVWRWSMREPAIASLGFSSGLLFFTCALLVLWQWRRAETNAAASRQLAYVSGMKSAFAEWKDGTLSETLVLLEQLRPKRKQEDLREFEWGYLWSQSHPRPVFAFPKRKQVVGSMAFAPDGSLLASYSWDDTLRFWDPNAPARELGVLTGVSSLGGFSSEQGRYIIGKRDGSIGLYDIRGAKFLSMFPTKGELVALSGDAETGATIDSENRLKVWNLATGKLLLAAPKPVARRADFIWGALVTLSHDGKILAFATAARNSKTAYKQIQVWNTETGEELPAIQLRAQIRSFAFSPTENILAIGDANGHLEICEIPSNRRMTLTGGDWPVFSLAFSKDGKILAAGGANEHVVIWDISTGLKLPGIMRAPLGDVWSLAFSPGSEMLATGGRDMEIRGWDRNRVATSDTIEGLLSDEWGNCVFSSDSQLVAGGCRDNTVRVYEVKSLKLIATLRRASYAVAFAPNNQDLLVADGEHRPSWWNIQSGNSRAIPVYGGVMSDVLSFDFCKASNLAALGIGDGTIQLFNVETGETVARWKAHKDAVRSVVFSPRGDKLVSGSGDRSVAEWEVSTRKNEGMRTDHRGAVCALAFSRNGKLFASGCGADVIRFWKEAELNLGSIAPSLNYHKAAIRALDFSAAGRTLASGSDDKTARLWNVPLHEELAIFVQEGAVRLVKFSPDGNTLAIVTDGGTLHLLRAAPIAEADSS